MTEENTPGNRQDDPSGIVVVGVGNLLMTDEGIGIHVLQSLQESGLPANVRLVDAGTSPDLIAYSGDCRKLIIIDAARGGGEPGTVYRLLPDDLKTPAGAFLSAHELGVEQSLTLMKLTASEPEEIVIIGIEPEKIAWGLELSPALRDRLPRITEIVLREISQAIKKG